MRPPSPSMLIALQDLAARGGQVSSRYMLSRRDGSRIHQNVVTSMINRGWMDVSPNPVRGGLRPVQITAAGLDVADGELHGQLSWYTVALETARQAATQEHEQRHGHETGIGAGSLTTMLGLVDKVMKTMYAAGRRQERWEVAAERSLDTRREIRRRLEEAGQYRGTEASKIKAILDGTP